MSEGGRVYYFVYQQNFLLHRRVVRFEHSLAGSMIQLAVKSVLANSRHLKREAQWSFRKGVTTWLLCVMFEFDLHPSFLADFAIPLGREVGGNWISL